MNAMKYEKWYKEAVVYQIYPRSFQDSNQDGIGDIQGIIQRLDYLVKLGINVVWLSPVYKSPNDDNGYDISDYTDILSEFGTLEDWKQMLGEMHKRGIKLVMDLVANHTSDEHPWFVESKSSLDNPKRDYYIWRKGKNNGRKPPNNWTSFFTGKAWEYDPHTNEYYLHLFSKKQPDLNWENPKVRNEIKEILRYWLDLGVDGFRCDVINIFSKKEGLPNGKWKIALTGSEHYLNEPKIHEYLRELKRDVLSKYDCFTVGETVFVTTMEALEYVGEKREELDMVFHFEHMAVDTINNKWFITKFKPKKLVKVLSKWQEDLNGRKHPEFGEGWNALYFENHDQPRSVSRFGCDGVYWQTSAKMLATALYFQKGTPYIYQGQEIGMTNAHFVRLEQYKDIETHNIYKIGRSMLHFTHKRMMKKIKYMSRDNARTPMQWTNEKYAGFSKTSPWIEVNPNKNVINASLQQTDPDSILSYYKQIIALRKKHRVLIHGEYREWRQPSPNLYIYERKEDAECIVVMTNFSRKSILPRIPNVLARENFEYLMGNYGMQPLSPHQQMRPYEARVYLLK